MIFFTLGKDAFGLQTQLTVNRRPIIGKKERNDNELCNHLRPAHCHAWMKRKIIIIVMVIVIVIWDFDSPCRNRRSRGVWWRDWKSDGSKLYCSVLCEVCGRGGGPGCAHFVIIGKIDFWVNDGNYEFLINFSVNRSVSYVREIFQKINGWVVEGEEIDFWRIFKKSRLLFLLRSVLIPGGSVYFPDSDKRGGYSFVARELLRLAAAANERNDYFPIWGTCLGFELMVYHEANGADVMTSCSAWNVPMKLKFTESAVSSRLFNPAPKAVVKLLATEKLTANFHRSCVTPQNFTSFRIDQGYKMLSRNFDQEAKVTFISTIEHRKYPFYGTQFHPEKNLYEWTEKEDIPHGFEASQVAQYFANFFVQEGIAITFLENCEILLNSVKFSLFQRGKTDTSSALLRKRTQSWSTIISRHLLDAMDRLLIRNISFNCLI